MQVTGVCQSEMTKSYRGLKEKFLVFLGSLGLKYKYIFRNPLLHTVYIGFYSYVYGDILLLQLITFDFHN